MAYFVVHLGPRREIEALGPVADREDAEALARRHLREDEPHLVVEKNWRTPRIVVPVVEPEDRPA